MNSKEIMQMDDENILHTYARFPVCLASGKGCRAKDANGKSYLDFTGGIGVNSLGWADDEWVAAVAGQAAALQHAGNIFYTEPAAKLAQLLCQKTGMDKVFFANSGAEANEGAIKAARKYSKDKYGQNRHTIISLVNSFHGRTMASLSATGQQHFHQHFQPFLPGFIHVPANNFAALENAIDGTVCAIMLELIQGEGGVMPLEKDYLQAVQKLCQKQYILLFVDEVQTGVGRTGKFLASQKYGLNPDIISLSKGLGGGLPIGAFMLGQKCASALSAGDHGSTFGANPVCCAGAAVVINRLTNKFLADVEKKGSALKSALQSLPGVKDVSGDGLMLGTLFCDEIKAADVLEKAMQAGLLCLTAKNKLRLLPPLTITMSEIEEGILILKTVLCQILPENQH